MGRQIKIDLKTRDPIISNNGFVFVDGKESILQNCEQALRQQLGELPYDTNLGVDYFDNAFLANPNFQLFEFQARQNLLRVDGVIKVNAFSYAVSDNMLNCTAELQLSNNETAQIVNEIPI